MLKINFKKVILVFFVCAAVFMSGCGADEVSVSKADAIQIKGSDTIVNLVQAWAEDFILSYPAVNIGITGGGSGTGFAGLINKTCDIAMSSRAIEPDEQTLAENAGVEPEEFIVGLDGLVILVNKNNPVNSLTLEQVKDIFTSKITNWKEVGGDDLKITILSRESNSGTHLFFKDNVLRSGDKNDKTEFAPRALLMPSSQAIYDEVLQNPHALGYVGMGYINDDVKALSIAKDSQSPAVYPNTDTVLDSSYPIARLLYLYTDGKPQGMVKSFIDFALSPRGQEIVKETDFVPLAQNK